MNRGLTMLLGVGVLMGGIAVAKLFRHTSPPPDLPESASSDRLVLREQNRPPAAGLPPAYPPTARIEASPVTSPLPGLQGRSPRRRAVIEPGQRPPRLARSYPRSDGRTAGRRSPSAGLASPRGQRFSDRVRTHKIVDGDTLPALAERYLGDANRYREIYAANRDLLPSPDILPIGVTLRIPPPTE